MNDDTTQVEVKEVERTTLDSLRESLSISLGIEALRDWLIRKLGGVPAESNCVFYNHAKEEMDLAWPESEPMQDLVKQNVLDIISVFSKQGHSGTSAPYVFSVAHKMSHFGNITPLTGKEGEWLYLDYGKEMKAQNRRCSSVFMRDDGSCYDIDGRIFVDDEGVPFSSSGSLVEVEFPYTPKTVYAYLDSDGNIIREKTEVR